MDHDHSNMDHSNMDHGDMDHGNMHHDHTGGSGAHEGMDHSIHSGHGMMMFFHISNNATILFDGWVTSTGWQMFGSCLVMVLLATLYEGLKVLREYLLRKALTCSCNGDAVAVPTTEAPPCEAEKSSRTRTARCRMFSFIHMIETLLHIIQITISYLLMLVVMTYNVWLCLAVIGGAGLGYFLFAWRRVTVVDFNEHCH